MQSYVSEYLYSEDSVEDDLKAVITEERFEGLVFPEQLDGKERALSCGSGNTKGWGVFKASSLQVIGAVGLSLWWSHVLAQTDCMAVSICLLCKHLVPGLAPCH